MRQQTSGIHHVTAFVRNAQETVDFYSGVLGLRLVKKTINFDAPEVYHLYFGNDAGSPGTVITFFPWPTSRQGRIGGGQVGITSYVVPAGSLDFWKARFEKLNIPVTLTTRFGEQLVQLSDPDGLRIEIVERDQGPASKWAFGGVPADKAIKGFGGAVLFSTAPARTAAVLEQVMGLEKIAEEGDFARFQATGDLGNIIDVNVSPMAQGIGGAGTVHHIAWRAKDDEDHARWRSVVEEGGFHPTPFIDRQYFNAIYFREEGGILFEIATDPPGFARDEPAETMGEKLMLPEWFEAHREQIEQGLPPIQVRVLEADQR
ncbi:ring-cleaving dioxygenase [Cohnella cholangitidis]|uniref:Ring-cleaving dioxygenase n=1 Tax=Cohnella cholangitidis TaxID=2598458 RepID=A0A7G5BY39_9BACL|nr:ring-cleaving dioxygenase [Cohnella cholangitidis]QMV41873.1 ring-cleaving dioxygenase [Cohnella cholangitidis]